MAKDTDYPGEEPYVIPKSKPKDGMDFEVSKSPMEVGSKENKPVKGDTKNPVVLP